MKTSVNFQRILVLILVSICLATFSATAQCDKKDSECWLEEGIYQIEEGDFDQAETNLKKTYKGVFNKAPKEIRQEAKEILKNKLPNFYKPIYEHFQVAEQNRAEGKFVSAVEEYKAAEKLAKRNIRFEKPHSKALDQQLLDKIIQVLPVLETERQEAVETAITVADQELDKENYARALSNYEIVLREGTASEIASNQAQQKADQCNFHVHLNKAKDLLATENCEAAFDNISKAVSYHSTPAARRILGEATQCAHDNQIVAGNGQLEIHEYEAAIAHFEKAKTYISNSLEATNGLLEARNQAALSYVDQAEAHFESENHAAAAEDFAKAMTYNSNVVNTEGESISSLMDKHYDSLNETAEAFYLQNEFLDAAADFKAAGYYMNKDLMEKREAFAKAVSKAYEAGKNPNRIATLSDLQNLRRLWNQAKKQMNGTNLSGGVDVAKKVKDLDSDINIAITMEALIPNLATASLEQKDAARKSLNRMKTDWKYKKDALAKLGPALPTMTATPATYWKTIFDFNSQAKYATWKSTKHGASKVNKLTFGVDSKNPGSSRMITRPLENGQTRRVLHTHPTWTPNGVIRGYFRDIPRLPANARLKGSYGFLKLPGSPKTDGARFFIYIRYHEGGTEKTKRLMKAYKLYDGRLRTINIDLSYYAGMRVSFELRVDTGDTPTQDWAMWDGVAVKVKN